MNEQTETKKRSLEDIEFEASVRELGAAILKNDKLRKAVGIGITVALIYAWLVSE
jgi:hypothetical protein